MLKQYFRFMIKKIMIITENFVSYPVLKFDLTTKGDIMKKVVFCIILLMAVIVGCNNNNNKLEPGTPAYDLGAEVATKVSFLDPDSNNVLISTKDFKISSGDMFQMFYTNMGERSKELANFEADRIKQIVKQSAGQMADQKLMINAAKSAGLSPEP